MKPLNSYRVKSTYTQPLSNLRNRLKVLGVKSQSKSINKYRLIKIRDEVADRPRKGQLYRALSSILQRSNSMRVKDY